MHKLLARQGRLTINLQVHRLIAPETKGREGVQANGNPLGL
jgi:hypothetical protein